MVISANRLLAPAEKITILNMIKIIFFSQISLITYLGSPNSSSSNLNGPSFIFRILTIYCIAFSPYCRNWEFSQNCIYPLKITFGNVLWGVWWHFNQKKQSKSVCNAFSQIFIFLIKMFNSLKCPKFGSFLFRLPKSRMADNFWFCISAPPLLLWSGRKIFTARVSGLNGKELSQGGHGWDK